LNSFSWPAGRAHAREGVRNPVKIIVYWMPFFNGMTTKTLVQSFPRDIQDRLILEKAMVQLKRDK
jgi:hypothetical protein